MSRPFLRWIWLAAVVPVLIAGYVYFKADKAATEAATELTNESRVSFELLNVSRPVLTGVELIPAAPDFRDLAAFDGRVYLSGAEGLTVYDRDMAHPKTWRAGMELPSSELGSMAVTALRGSAGQELLIATRGAGLLRFDGAQFRQVLPRRPELRRITALLPLHTGRVLLGTETAGVAVFDGERVTMLDPALASEHITALAGDDQDLWIGTLLHGLWHLHAGQMERIEAALPDPQVLSLAVNGERTFAGTPLGVVEFQAGRKTRTLAEGTFARALAADEVAVSIGTEDEGLFEVSFVQRAHVESADGVLAGEPIQRILALKGAKYCLTPTAVFRKSGARWEKAAGPEKSTLADRHVSALAVGQGGALWVGYFDRGLDILSGNRETSRHFEDDRLFCVNRIVTDGAARTAVATANGLVMFAGDQPRQVLSLKDGLIADHITDVAFENGGMIAATPAGISFVDGGGVRSVYVFNGLVNNHVYALGLAGDRLLAGTLGGVSVMDREVVEANYTTGNSGLKHNWITALVHVGDDWFAGTYGAGVLSMDARGVWRGFPDLSGDDAKFVVNPNAMMLADGRVYAGSLDHGLYIYDMNAGRWRNTSAGLPSENVTALASSGGDLYVGTANGVVRFEEHFLP